MKDSPRKRLRLGLTDYMMRFQSCSFASVFRLLQWLIFSIYCQLAAALVVSKSGRSVRLPSSTGQCLGLWHQAAKRFAADPT